MSFQKVLLAFLFLAITRCGAKEDKRPTPVAATPPPSPHPTPSPTKRPTQSPVKKPVAVDRVIQMDLDTFQVNFESTNGSPIVVDKESLEYSSEEYFEEFIDSLDENDPVKQNFNGLILKVDLTNVRRNVRRLQSTGVNAEIGGTISFSENGAPDARIVKDVQKQAFTDSLFSSRLESSFDNVSVKVSYGSPGVGVENDDSNVAGTTIGGKNSTGGTVGGVVGAFAVIGLGAFVFVQYKRRKTAGSDKNSNESYYVPEVHVEAADIGADGEQSFEAVMSPTFSIQESVKVDSCAKRGFKMPLGTKLKSFSSRKSGMSVTGHDEYDAYSLDGSMALGQTPNLGDQMLGQVLAMSSYTPVLDDDDDDDDDNNLNNELSPGKPRMIRVASGDSIDSHHQDCSFDSPSVMGNVSVSGNSMMSESVTAHGRTLTIGNRQSFVHLNPSSKKEIPSDDSSGDGIEVAIDAVSISDVDSLSNGVATKKTSLGTPARTAPGQSTSSSFSPVKTMLNFSPKRKEDYKVNIVETEQPLRSNSNTNTRNEDFEKKTYRGNRQVQRVEEKHKVTITTESSNPTLVRSSFPVQSARAFTTYNKDAKDDDSYSSYYSSEDEEEAISALLRSAREQVNQQMTSGSEVPSSQNKSITNVTRKTSKPTTGNGMFPVRIAQQYPTQRTPTKSSSTDPFYLASSRKQAIENTIKSKGISTTNYAAEARRNRMARNAVTSNKASRSDEGDESSIANQVASLEELAYSKGDEKSPTLFDDVNESALDKFCSRPYRERSAV
eukprot:CAMPEP_0176500776 /NCGR_PEP_ID=MMETSP0200_2-20121128/13778_1 /TAXON_ID=947934 /ORGANISM="Chaetoceros sp., Strain GSL56" /LENGTH=777 /DNA_ID=CAMNT_0017899559 /DNA_START=257 /DNA_END=2588 /DNA_ORIENTATION=-